MPRFGPWLQGMCNYPCLDRYLTSCLAVGLTNSAVACVTCITYIYAIDNQPSKLPPFHRVFHRHAVHLQAGHQQEFEHMNGIRQTEDVEHRKHGSSLGGRAGPTRSTASTSKPTDGKYSEKP